MRPPVALKPHLNVEQIKDYLYQSRNGHHASYWQIILTVNLNPGKATKDYCAYLGISGSKFHRIVALYNKIGASFCEALRWGGRREKRCLLSFDQEEELLQDWTEAALHGEVLVAKQLREAVAQKVGHSVSDNYLWDMLHRHGWSKKAPRPEHPKAAQAKEKREAFKKKHPHFSFQKTQPNR
ncbi:MAG: winged helix-turn-helix domain-containing protein [Flavisolibacter sp.]|nr:winged helix-turn-helix domain-containing protein [Flavisolibacter sp.]